MPARESPTARRARMTFVSLACGGRNRPVLFTEPTARADGVYRASHEKELKQPKRRTHEPIECLSRAQSPTEPACSKHRDDQGAASSADDGLCPKRRVIGILFAFRHIRYDLLSLLHRDAAHGGAPDFQAAGDFGFTCARAVEFPNLVGVEGCCYRPAQPLAVLPSLSQSGADSFPQNLPFEFGEDRQETGHGSASWRGQIRHLGQRDEADSKMFQFLQGSPADL